MSEAMWCRPSSCSTSFVAAKIGRSGQPTQKPGGRPGTTRVRSGMSWPLRSMPRWAQMLAEISPMKHFIVIMREVLVKGAGLADVQAPLLVLLVYGVGMLTLAMRSYSKTTA